VPAEDSLSPLDQIVALLGRRPQWPVPAVAGPALRTADRRGAAAVARALG
jgi:hypothetical protein